MIYTLRVELIQSLYWDKECVRVIEIPKDYSLMRLHDAIQDAVKFDNDHLYEFYAGRDHRNRAIRYGDVEDNEDFETQLNEYARIQLDEVYPLERMKLYYLFDFGDGWLFEIKKLRALKPVDPRAKYPRVIERIGRNPVQYPRYE
jgi:hypothetical protein